MLRWKHLKFEYYRFFAVGHVTISSTKIKFIVVHQVFLLFTSVLVIKAFFVIFNYKKVVAFDSKALK